MRGKIILDPGVLQDQVKSLDTHGSTLASAAQQAQVSMPAEAFGHLNSYLPGPCNGLAGKASTLLSSASELLSAMSTGVDGVFTAFENIEAEAAATIAKFEP